MRIAFYAPMKPVDSPVPSGDRTIGRAVVRGLGLAGAEVRIASRIRSFDRQGCVERQKRLRLVLVRERQRIVRRWQALGWSPQVWLTYHLYDRAPDLLGPEIAAGLQIPYVVMEASVADSRRTGPWQDSWQSVVQALHTASLVIGINPRDRAGVLPYLADRDRYTESLVSLPQPAWMPSPAARRRRRAALSRRLGLRSRQPWLLTVAMMRGGVKEVSWQVLERAIRRLARLSPRLRLDWLIVGDGPRGTRIRRQLRAAAAGKPVRVRLPGRLSPAQLRGLAPCADLAVWPAVGEAVCMSLVEAQASGLAALFGRTPGTARIAARSGGARLVPARDARALAHQIHTLLRQPQTRARMALRAAQRRQFFQPGPGGDRLLRLLHRTVQGFPHP